MVYKLYSYSAVDGRRVETEQLFTNIKDAKAYVRKYFEGVLNGREVFIEQDGKLIASKVLGRKYWQYEPDVQPETTSHESEDN